MSETGPAKHSHSPLIGLYSGTVFHKRHAPKPHAFTYRIFALLIDIDAAIAAGKGPGLFSYNRPGLISFANRDHGPGDGMPLRSWVEAQLSAVDLPAPEGAIHLLCLPRVLGFQFKPLSVYFCHNKQGDLIAVLYEVHNTFGQQHVYIAATDAVPATGLLHHDAEKSFHVSPFFDVSGTYKFRLHPPEKRFFLSVETMQPSGQEHFASWDMAFMPANAHSLKRLMLDLPLVAQKTFAAIHFEAFRLVLKGARYHKLPAQRPSPTLSR